MPSVSLASDKTQNSNNKKTRREKDWLESDPIESPNQKYSQAPPHICVRNKITHKRQTERAQTHPREQKQEQRPRTTKMYQHNKCCTAEQISLNHLSTHSPSPSSPGYCATAASKRWRKTEGSGLGVPARECHRPEVYLNINVRQNRRSYTTVVYFSIHM